MKPVVERNRKTTDICLGTTGFGELVGEKLTKESVHIAIDNILHSITNDLRDQGALDRVFDKLEPFGGVFYLVEYEGYDGACKIGAYQSFYKETEAELAARIEKEEKHLAEWKAKEVIRLEKKLKALGGKSE